ncbi:hypothetical protein KDW_07020 [Dictyobacter vulcani]|uniref:site-specific DNA-methyltransferase (adenine-specific) n=2 Tax=Dictyobacter vulcani TaxID=2607529 RepID=A0A5J4KJK9_9CHLR|nr:hypothetical protein KDW_07020 [Dictyobacter vulcani]
MLFLIDDINFFDLEHQYAIASLYEGYIQDMEISVTSARDFFTPREIKNTMLKMLKPQQNQTFFDPACGTGGMLIEAYEYIKSHHGQKASQSMLLFGQALDSTGALISAINMASIGKPVEHIYHGDMLQGYPDHFPKGFDYVLANPPFGIIKDEQARKNPFFKTLYYEPLLLQSFIDAISEEGGTSSVIVSITTLTRDIAAFVDVRERLLTECDLLMVIVLPPGVFAPHTDVRTSILFFRKPGPTRETFYYNACPSEESLKYEHPLLDQYLSQAVEACGKWQQYRISGKGRPESIENSWIETFNNETFRENKYRLGTHCSYVPMEEPLLPEAPIDILLEYNHRFYHTVDNLSLPVELTSQLLKYSQEFHQQLSAFHKDIE